jgi:hypothetical protein
LVPIIVVSTSNITGKNQVEKMYFVVFFLFSWFKWTTKSTNNRTRPLTIISQYQLTFKYEKWISSALHMKKCKSVPKNNFQSMEKKYNEIHFFHLIFACNVWSRNHDNWYQWIKVLSQYISFFYFSGILVTLYNI